MAIPVILGFFVLLPAAMFLAGNMITGVGGVLVLAAMVGTMIGGLAGLAKLIERTQ